MAQACSSAGLLILLFCRFVQVVQACENTPPLGEAFDTRYQLNIAGDPAHFLPGETYTVILRGVEGALGTTTFNGFVIWVAAEAGAEGNSSGSGVGTGAPAGALQTYDSQSKPLEGCPLGVAVVNSTDQPKTEIQVLWTAPTGSEPGAGAGQACVRLAARCGKSTDAAGAWSVLQRRACLASQPQKHAYAYGAQPPVLETCCACDEAKYEVTFEGLWSRHTHPKDFPADDLVPRFSDVIGASHTAQHRVWQEGRLASEGLRDLAEHGTSTTLERELKAESEHIRTIIKARGMSYPRLNGATFAVFRVDARHHLVSLVAKLSPSPDWLVGVSALELCTANCSWEPAAALPLYPYDAGTDSGITYTSRGLRTSPPAPVRALRPDWPRDPRSPFYSGAGGGAVSGPGDMKPFARLRLTRQRLYEKSCDHEPANSNANAEAHAARKGAGSSAAAAAAVAAAAAAPAAGCATNGWSVWGPCSVTCGTGVQVRRRSYLRPARARLDACTAALLDRRSCHGLRKHCRVPSEYEPDPAEKSGFCAVSPWTEWSECESPCGLRVRTRRYLNPRAFKRCNNGIQARPRLSQTLPCTLGPINCTRSGNDTATGLFYQDVMGAKCRVSSWGEWSPCSAQCGGGRRLRTRVYLVRDSSLQHRLLHYLTHLWSRRFASWQGLELSERNSSADPEVLDVVARCQYTLTQQHAPCLAVEVGTATASVGTGTGTGACARLPDPHEVCGLPKVVGPCRGYQERWFYDAPTRTCEPFGFTGCGGNANNFPNRHSCLAVCRNYTGPVASVAEAATPSKSKTHLISNDVVQNDGNTLIGVELSDDCWVSAWSGWGVCAGDCEHAFRLNYRRVLRPGRGEGQPCPTSLVKSRSCRHRHCRTTSTTSPSPAPAPAPIVKPSDQP